MLQSTMVFFSYGANVLVQFGDGFLTQVGLSKGFVEGNKLTSFLFKKFGTTLTNFIKIGLVPFVTALGFAIAKHPEYANVLNFTLAAVTIPVVIRNFILLKRAKISIFS